MIALITSVQYADYLAVTLPAWRRTLPGADLRVLTSWRDPETQRVARRCGVPAYRTNAWTRGAAAFNRAAALDEAFAAAQPGEVCLSIDADVYPGGPCPDEVAIQPGILYGCARYLCRQSRDLKAHLEGRVPREALPLMDTKMTTKRGYAVSPHSEAAAIRAGAACLGYFQCFRMAGQRFGSYPSAGGYDTDFARQFKGLASLEPFYVVHLGLSCGRNWSRRVLPRWTVTA